MPREDVDDDRGRVDSLFKSFGAGGFDGSQAVIGHATEDLDHLAIAIIAALQFAADRSHGRWQHPVLEWRTIA